MTVNYDNKDKRTPWNAGKLLSPVQSERDKKTGWQTAHGKPIIKVETGLDPDEWKQDWKPLDINGKYAHLRCNGRPGPISLHSKARSPEEEEAEAATGNNDADIDIDNEEDDT